MTSRSCGRMSLELNPKRLSGVVRSVVATPKNLKHCAVTSRRGLCGVEWWKGCATSSVCSNVDSDDEISFVVLVRSLEGASRFLWLGRYSGLFMGCFLWIGVCLRDVLWNVPAAACQLLAMLRLP